MKFNGFLSKKMLLVAALLIFLVLTFGAYAFYLLFTGNPRDASWVLKSNEGIDSIEYTVNENSDTHKSAAVVYLVSNGERKKLPEDDIITVNGFPMKVEYYSGESAGYKYVLDMREAGEYELHLQRTSGEEVNKIIKSINFSFRIPEKISRKNGFIISFEADGYPADGKLFTKFTAISSEPITHDGKKGLIVNGEIGTDKITIPSEELETLKIGESEVYVGIRFGDFISSNEKVVQIVD